VFLGATVADATARPSRWVYNQKKLLTLLDAGNSVIRLGLV